MRILQHFTMCKQASMTQSTLFEQRPKSGSAEDSSPLPGFGVFPKNSCFSFCRSPQATCKEERRDQGTPLKPRSGAAGPNNPASQAARSSLSGGWSRESLERKLKSPVSARCKASRSGFHTAQFVYRNASIYSLYILEPEESLFHGTWGEIT